jgi:hypothetical protein
MKIHTLYINSKIEDTTFDDKSFDAVVLLEVLEHMDKESGEKVINMAKRIAKKKVILSTPNGFINQNEVDGNSLQKHLSGWKVADLAEYGFRCTGLAGLGILRCEKDEDTMNEDILVSIKYKPKIFWFILSALSQAITYYIPDLAFGLFALYKIPEAYDSNN